MNSVAYARLFDCRRAFDDPFTRWVTAILAVLLIGSLLLIVLLRFIGWISAQHYRELLLRSASWCILVPVMLIPVLLGAVWAIAAAAILALLAFREYSGAMGIAAERKLAAMVYVGILLLTAAALDNWYAFFVALSPLVTGAIAAFAILEDQPHGYVRRVALAVWGFLLFGSGLGHVAFLANDADYRPMLILLLMSVELNDVFAYCCGKLFGKRKLAPHTSPNKTIGGSLGAVVLTTLLVMTCGRFVFAGSPLVHPLHLAAVGISISVLGQLGDLMVSSVKRDLGIKDMGALIPGHGGLLDRFDSLLLAAPAFFHYVNYFRGIGLEQPSRIFF